MPPEQSNRVHGTSGTTGVPRIRYQSHGLGPHRRGPRPHSVGCRLRPNDTVMVAAVFSLYVGSWAHWSAPNVSARPASPSAPRPGQTERAVGGPRWCTHALYGTPSYALYLAETAREMRCVPAPISPSGSCFQRRAGASVPATRQAIEDAFGCYVVDQGSMAEMTRG